MSSFIEREREILKLTPIGAIRRTLTIGLGTSILNGGTTTPAATARTKRIVCVRFALYPNNLAMRRQQLILHVTSLTIGSLIYICFRTDTLIMFKWFDKLMLTNTITTIREFTLPFKNKLPSWFLYSIPDGLWVFSYVCLMLFIWERTVKRNNLFWFTLIPSIALFSEIGQLIKVVPGTFEVADLSLYVIGFFLPLIAFTNNYKIKNSTT